MQQHWSMAVGLKGSLFRHLKVCSINSEELWHGGFSQVLISGLLSGWIGWQ